MHVAKPAKNDSAVKSPGGKVARMQGPTAPRGYPWPDQGSVHQRECTDGANRDIEWEGHHHTANRIHQHVNQGGIQPLQSVHVTNSRWVQWHG